MQANKWFSFAFRLSIRALSRRIEISSIIMAPILLFVLSVPAYPAVFNIASATSRPDRRDQCRKCNG